jgi:arylsulfatase A-like enzyme
LFLQTTDWAGVIFTKDGLEGTFKLSDVGLDTADGPDVVVSMRWDARMVVGGMQGTLVADTTYKLGQGMHGSLSRFDMHNTLIAAGPDFKPGNVNQLPTSNSDVAPTAANILGIEPKEPMDGRILIEALSNGQAQEPVPKTTTVEASRKLGEKTWSQYLRVTELGKQRYYDEGNAGAPPK